MTLNQYVINRAITEANTHRLPFSTTILSKFSTNSPWNKYSTSDSVPVLVDEYGNFYGYFTINNYRGNAVNFSRELKELFDRVNGDLEIIQKILCRN